MLKVKVFCAFALLALCAAGRAEDAPKADAKVDKEKVSYAIGLSVGRNIKADGIDGDVDAAIILKGLQDGLSGAKPQFSETDLRNAMMALQMAKMSPEQKAQYEAQMKQRQEAERTAKVAGEKNKKDGEAFLAENAKKDGVKTTASGLQYKVLKEGDGAMPKATDTVKTHYKGTLIDGAEFDSSYARNEPAVFPVNGVIKGWTEVLQLMKVGSKYQVFIPSDLAYGERGAGDRIGPNCALVFDVELLGIEGAAPAQK